MSPGYRGKIRHWVFLATFIGIGCHAPAVSAAQDQARLQQLLYGEALFHAHQQDYLAAISRLQMAQEQGLSPSSSQEAKLLLARMKLAFGLHLEAGFDLHALSGEGVPRADRNRAWYELARAFAHKGYNEAAAEALSNIQGEMPADIAGDHQLLHATVLMSLGRNMEAAELLTPWRGEPEMAAYAHYNRGIALVRAGDYARVTPALEMAVNMPARGEELLALRDKARLALGYAFAREQDFKRASRQLQAVRPEGPFQNRALLAMGWIDYKQGRSESALAAWMELRGRSPTDPAVLETLLVVPAVHRELDALQTATQDYETALSTYTRELTQLQSARDAVSAGGVTRQVFRDEHPPSTDGHPPNQTAAERFLGPLLASRNFTEIQRGHQELQAMLARIDRELGQLDKLSGFSASTGDAVSVPEALVVPPPPAGASATTNDKPQALAGYGTRWRRDWVLREAEPAESTQAQIPTLPELELPAETPLKTLPPPQPPSRPSVSNYLREPPSAQVIGLPDSEIIRLPDSGDFFQRPESGEFFRRPGQEELEDYAYPDQVARHRPGQPEAYAVQVNRLLPNQVEKSNFNAAVVPVGEALRDLAAALGRASGRVAQLEGALAADEGLNQRLAAVRARLVGLRSRIATTITLHEDYTRSLALAELDRRKLLLEDLLEQASLELAKTYDQSIER